MPRLAPFCFAVLLAACGGSGGGGDPTLTGPTATTTTTVATSTTTTSLPDPDAALNVPGDFGTIQAALDAAAAGDVVVVAAGTYFESLVLTGTVSIEGAGPSVTRIVGNAIRPVLTIRDSAGAATVSGIGISNGSQGIHLNATNMTLADCEITGNLADGINVLAATVRIEDCRVHNNGRDGVRGDTGARVTLQDVSVVDNGRHGVSGGAPLVMSHCIVAFNARDGINSGNANIRFCTVRNNGDDGIDISGGGSAVTNSIVSDHNTGADPAGLNDPGMVTTTSNMLFWNNGCDWFSGAVCVVGPVAYAAVASAVADPLFMGALDFHLSPGSPGLTLSVFGGEVGAYGAGGNPPGL